MKKYTYLIVLFIVFGCKKEDSIIPTYININTITLNENDVTTNIIDAWVYVDDQLQGVYELPAIFPVLALGEHNVRVRAGIKSNGIASSRIAYPFYSSFFDTLMFIEDQITTITPTVSYLDDVDFFLEDFEGAGMDLEITAISDTALLEFTDSSGNQYGGGILNDSLFTFEIATDELLDLPQS